jgi:hypothetical protein
MGLCPKPYFLLCHCCKEGSKKDLDKTTPNALCRKAGISNKVVAAPDIRLISYRQKFTLSGSAKAKALYKKFHASRHSQLRHHRVLSWPAHGSSYEAVHYS